MRFSEMTAQRSWKRFSEMLKKVSGKKQRLWRCTGKGDILSRERISPFPVQRQRRCFFPETFLSISEKRFQLLCAVISEKRIKRRIHRAAAKVAVNAHMLDALVEADISCAVAGRGVVGCTQCFGGFQLVVRAIV